MPQTKKTTSTKQKTDSSAKKKAPARELEFTAPLRSAPARSASAKSGGAAVSKSASKGGSTRSTAKKTAARPLNEKVKKAAPVKAKRPPAHIDEIIGVILIALGIVMGIMTYTHTNAIFDKVVTALFGLFGVIQYAVPVVLVALGIMLIAIPRRQAGTGIILALIGAVLCVDCVIHLARLKVAGAAFSEYTSQSYKLGRIGQGGGWVSSIPAYGLTKLLSPAGAIVVFVALALILVMLATRLSIRSAGQKLVARADARASRRRERRYEQTELDDAEEEAPAYVPPAANTPRGRRRRLAEETFIDARAAAPHEDELKLAEGVESLSGRRRGRSRMKVEEATLDSIIENARDAGKNEPSLDILPKKGKLPPSAPSRRRLREQKAAPRETYIPPIEPENENIPVQDYDPFETIEIVPEDNITGQTAEEALNSNKPAEKRPERANEAPEAESAEAEVKEASPVKAYRKPPISLLRMPDHSEAIANDSPTEKAKLLIETLASFNISAKVTNISVGPVITRFEIQPAQGVRVNRITSLSNDIALALAAPRVRIEAPIPGKAAVGIEIPNKDTAMVRLREVIDTREFSVASSPLTFALGKDIAGKPVYANLEKMPHMLIAGATGSGKSVCINSILLSTVYKATPEEVRMILIDPKVVELSIFAPMPHLYCPIVTDPKKAAGVLKWACNEMDQRYSKMSKLNARDLARYNSLQEKPEDRLPRLMIVIDELADLMIVSAKDVEDSIARLAQLGRACGIHLIVATQRPSVDIITGLIKANIPSRIAFAVSSAMDSRVILDAGGAEKLLGHGDMLFHPNGAAKPIRAQGAFVDDEEVERIMKFFEENNMSAPQDERVLTAIPELTASTGQGNGKQEDELLPDAVRIVMDSGSASISMIQRRLRVGYARAARLVDIMEQMKLVSGFDGSKPRKVLIDEAGYAELFGGGYAPAPAGAAEEEPSSDYEE